MASSIWLISKNIRNHINISGNRSSNNSCPALFFLTQGATSHGSSTRLLATGRHSAVVVVESPTKAKKLQTYLGNEYKVVASMGHVCDLERRDDAVLPDKDFEAKWQVSASGDKQLYIISHELNKCDRLVLATDLDREGEAISWHILEQLKKNSSIKNQRIERITFSEISRTSILNAMKAPREINQYLVDAYMSRRIIDFLVGFTISPILWRKVPSAKSAGRVQSTALRLLCDREEEIFKFNSRVYYTVEAKLWTTSNCMIPAFLSFVNGAKIGNAGIKSKKESESAVYQISNADLTVVSVDKSVTHRKPPPPFKTSTLQQEASRKLRFSPGTTMLIAQKLYEGEDMERSGLITYTRTDSINMSETATEDVRRAIVSKYGKEYLPEVARIFNDKSKNAQEAHEAIRPVDMSITADDLPRLMPQDQKKLYDLIWKRTMASQMQDAKYERLSFKIADESQQIALKSSVRCNIFKGFLTAYDDKVLESDAEGAANSKKKDEEQVDLEEIQYKLLEVVKVGEKITSSEPIAKKHETAPPPRYNDASLISSLEDYGIGRPSTYSNILKTIVTRAYAKKTHIGYKPSPLGLIVTSFLKKYFSKYVDYQLTANLEEKFDAITNGGINWKAVTREFWEFLKSESNKLEQVSVSEIIDMANSELLPVIFKPFVSPDRSLEDMLTCPSCRNGKLVMKFSFKSRGPFLGCCNYANGFCKYTRSIEEQKEPTGEAGAMMSGSILHSFGNDPKTGGEVFIKLGRFGPYAEISHDNPAFRRRKSLSSSKNDVNSFTLERVLEHLEPLKDFGFHPVSGDIHYKNNFQGSIFKSALGLPLTLEKGRRNHILQHGNFQTPLPRKYDWYTLSKDKVLEIIKKEEPKSKYAKMPVKKKSKSIGEVRVEIKKPRSAYIFFVKENRHVLKNQNPTATNVELVKILAKKWKEEISKEDMKIYQEMAARDKDRYMKDLDSYTFAVNNNDYVALSKFQEEK